MRFLNGSWHYTIGLWRNTNTDRVRSSGQWRQVKQAQTAKLSPRPPPPRSLRLPLSVGSENWAEVFVIKYVRGKLREMDLISYRGTWLRGS